MGGVGDIRVERKGETVRVGRVSRPKGKKSRLPFVKSDFQAKTSGGRDTRQVEHCMASHVLTYF